MKRINYRKIWEHYHNQKIPVGFEIHHIDGDCTNNDVSNLQLVTTEEHLNIHISQEDWGAVQSILIRMDYDQSLLSEVARQAQLKRIEQGTHNFQKMSCASKFARSSKAGKYTRDNKIGIHAINADPEKARENAKKGGLRAKELQAGFLNVNSSQHGSRAVKGTFWWVNKNGKRKRSKVCPGEGWIAGSIYKEENNESKVSEL